MELAAVRPTTPAAFTRVCIDRCEHCGTHGSACVPANSRDWPSSQNRFGTRVSNRAGASDRKGDSGFKCASLWSKWNVVVWDQFLKLHLFVLDFSNDRR